jgi:hypothetical protein
LESGRTTLVIVCYICPQSINKEDSKGIVIVDEKVKEERRRAGATTGLISV